MIEELLNSFIMLQKVKPVRIVSFFNVEKKKPIKDIDVQRFMELVDVLQIF